MPREGCQNWPISCNLGMAWPIVTKFGVFGDQVAMRTRADISSFPYLGNGLVDCAEIWCVVRDTLARRSTKKKK